MHKHTHTKVRCYLRLLSFSSLFRHFLSWSLYIMYKQAHTHTHTHPHTHKHHQMMMQRKEVHIRYDDQNEPVDKEDCYKDYELAYESVVDRCCNFPVAHELTISTDQILL